MIVLFLPILFNLIKTARNVTTRWTLGEYGKCLLCQFLVPYYAFKSMRNPENAQLKANLWKYKVKVGDIIHLDTVVQESCTFRLE